LPPAVLPSSDPSETMLVVAGPNEPDAPSSTRVGVEQPTASAQAHHVSVVADKPHLLLIVSRFIARPFVQPSP
jgi:hypothetical protein